MLIYGSAYFIDGATQIAILFGISSYTIGLTLTALGTSLPELAASIQSARKDRTDFIIGNIIGSNIFNIAIAASVAGLINSAIVNKTEFIRDISVLLTVSIFFYMIIKSNKTFIKTLYSSVLVITYFVYIYFIYRVNMNKKSNKQLAKEILNREIAALKRTTKLLDNKFERACDAIISNKGKVITLGIGKSSFIAMKMAATLSSTGTAALFLHPVDALHGDVGVIKKNDVVIIYSNSGETQEVIKLLPLLKLLKCCIISITGNLSSSLAQYSEYFSGCISDKRGVPT